MLGVFNLFQYLKTAQPACNEKFRNTKTIPRSMVRKLLQSQDFKLVRAKKYFSSCDIDLILQGYKGSQVREPHEHVKIA